MAPKGGKAAKKEVEESEEPLQAVILADSFNSRFKPLTVDKPRCLLPLCNVPLIEWTLESLAIAGVEQAIVFCNAHADKLKAYLHSSKWFLPQSGMRLTIIVSAEAMSVGDAMRELDAKNLIKSDFILVSGDVVSNVAIRDVVEEHKRRRKVDKDAIMTMVVKEAGPFHRTRPIGDASVFVLDPSSSQCLHYEHVPGYPRKRRVKIPGSILEEHAEVQFRNDLVDCGIDICSIDVPPLFSENFDYQDMRRDFVNGILTSDLLDSKIFAHVVSASRGYASRVKDPKSYDSVSQDIMSRWTFPLVPDGNLPGGDRYYQRHGHQYIASEGVVLSRTCKIGSNTMIGARSRVGEDVQLDASVLGPDVKIGSSSTIAGSYLWPSVSIGSNCSIADAILGEGVTILDGVTLHKGCLVAGGVTVGPNVIVPQYSKVSKDGAGGDEDWGIDEDSDNKASKVIRDDALGAQAVGFFWPGADEEDVSESQDDEDEAQNVALSRLAVDTSKLDLSDSASTLSSISYATDDEAGSVFSGRSFASSAAERPMLSVPTDADAAASRMADFRSEARQSLQRAFDEGHTVENAMIELKTLRMASNVPLSEVRKVVMAAVLGRCGPPPATGATEKVVASKLEPVLDRWGGLIEATAAGDEVDAILALQQFCSTQEGYSAVFMPALKLYYSNEYVSTASLVDWYKSPLSRSVEEMGEAGRELWAKAKAFVMWAVENEESEDEEDESE